MNKYKNYHHFTVAQTLAELDSFERGLSSSEAERRLERFGHNELPEAKRDSIVAIFLRQFKSPLIFILLIAASMVFLSGEMTDALVILFVLVFNAVVGTVQEGKAQNTFLALKKFIKGRAFVLRDHEETIIPDKWLVPGDIVMLREGEKVPTDVRIIRSNALRIDESALTGESLPKNKNADPIKDEETMVSDRSNMAFKGTIVVSGNGTAVVVATGIDTFLGEIANETLVIGADFPLKNDIRKLSRFVIFFVAAVAFVIFFLGMFNGHALGDTLRAIVAISVSVIPEGLPIVMTIVLAGGVWRMSKKNVLVKKLQAIEVLGETKILAVDKTGTITRNELAIESVYVDGKVFEIRGSGYYPEGETFFDGAVIDPLNHPELLFAGKIAALNSSASHIFHKKSDRWEIAGDPTEAALLVFSKKIGFRREDLLVELPMMDELPFDYEQKIHASLHRSSDGNLLVATGSPEKILSLSGYESDGDDKRKISAEREEELEGILHSFSQKGLRVIGFAHRATRGETIDASAMKSLVFGGFFGIKDTLREEVKDAVRQVESSGMKVVMITGDHAATARAIASEAGIYKDGDRVLDGGEIDGLSDVELSEAIREASVFSRVTPKHKLRIIQAYRAGGSVVAMTGDGVNDALSLSAADIGIGMGKIGTDVAKEASDVILLDDNFGSIVHGVEEGRNILASIKKVILYLFSTSLGEVLLFVGALVVGFPLPILAVQILWLNLVTDGFLDMALAMEPEEVSKGRIFKKTNLIDTFMIHRMIFMAMPMAAGTMLLFSQYYQENLAKAWTVSLTTLAVFQWFNAWNCRSEQRSIFRMNPFLNKFLLGATLIVILLQILAVYNPFFQKVLRTVPLSGKDWLVIVFVAFSIVAVEEARKMFYRTRRS